MLQMIATDHLRFYNKLANVLIFSTKSKYVCRVSFDNPMCGCASARSYNKLANVLIFSTKSKYVCRVSFDNPRYGRASARSSFSLTPISRSVLINSFIKRTGYVELMSSRSFLPIPYF